MSEDSTYDCALAEVRLTDPRKAFEALVAADNLEQLESVMRMQPALSCPLTHRFTKAVVGGEPRGIYVREIFMPAGALIISKVHKTQHPFTVLEGSASVFTPGVGTALLKAGHLGITEPGTVRLLFIHEDCRWATFHPTNETDLEKIEEEVIAKPGEFIPLAPVEVVALEASK